MYVLFIEREYFLFRIRYFLVVHNSEDEKREKEVKNIKRYIKKTLLAERFLFQGFRQFVFLIF